MPEATTKPKLAGKNFSMKGKLSKFFSFPIAPYRQFKRLLFISIALFIGLVVYHIYFFKSAASIDVFHGEVTTKIPAPKVDDKKLDSVLKRYADKETARAGAMKLVPPVVDPGK